MSRHCEAAQGSTLSFAITGVLPNLLFLVLTLAGVASQQDALGWALLGCASLVALVGPLIGYRRFFADRYCHDGQRLSIGARMLVVIQTFWQMRFSFAFYLVTGCIAVYVVLLCIVSVG